MSLAIDLGCGDGTETIALLHSGWRVLAVDQEPAAIARLQSQVLPKYQAQLETRVCSFEDLSLPPAGFIYAGYSLPFCAPEQFTSCWKTIVASLRPGGRFAGQLFGVRDAWSSLRNMTFHTAEAVLHLFQEPFQVEYFREIEEDGKSFGGPKHWHVFEVIAQKAPVAER